MAEAALWDDTAWSGFGALQGEHSADFCVIGLGGGGLAAVAELMAHGHSVIGLDAGPVGAGAAGRNGGFLLAGLARFHHDAVAAHGELAVALYRETLDELGRMAAEFPELVRIRGTLRIAEDDDELADCEEQYDALRADGFAVQHYRGNEGRGLLLPDDGAFHPLARLRLAAQRVANDGARLFERSPALAVGGQEVVSAQGRVLCRRCIVCVDGGLESLLPELAPRVRTARLQMLATAPSNEVRFERPVYARYGLDYWQQTRDGRIALGGARDRGGPDEWTLDAASTPVVQQALEDLLRHRLGVHAPITHRWAAHVAFTHDGLPILEQIRPDVFVAGAYNGTGNILSVLCGRAAARMAMGAADSISSLLVRGH